MLVVWLDMLPTDSAETAAKSAAIFNDPRVRQFHDEEQAGRSFAAAWGYPEEIAWDCYLFYEPGATWEDLPPQPASFAHQLGEGPVAIQPYYKTGAELHEFIAAEVGRSVPEAKSAGR